MSAGNFSVISLYIDVYLGIYKIYKIILNITNIIFIMHNILLL